MVSQKSIVVQVCVRNGGKLNGPELDKNGVFFLDDCSYVAKVAEQVIDLFDLYVFLVPES